MSVRHEVAVIGGGIAGASVLYHLAVMGVNDPLLLERAELTAGSTWHAAGNTHTLNSSANIVRMQAYSLELYAQLEKTLRRELGFHVPGGYLLGRHRDRAQEFATYAGRALRLGLGHRMADLDEVAERHPLLDLSGVACALFDPEDGHIDPYSITHALVEAAVSHGAQVRRQCAVIEQHPTSDGGWRLVTPGGDIEAHHVVNAGGLWARQVGEMVGLCLPIVAMEHHYLVTEDMPAVAGRDRELPVIRDMDYQFYLRQEGAGLLAGPWEDDCRAWAVDGVSWDFGQELLADDLGRMERELAMIVDSCPALGEAGVKRVVNGPITFTPDGRPLLGPAPGLRNYHVCAGFLGGITQAGGAGRAVAEWIVHGEPWLDLFDLDVTRFGDHATRDYTLAKAMDIFPRRYAVPYPNEERAAGRPSRTCGVHHALSAAGAVFGTVNGWERPLWFRSVSDDVGESEPLTYGRGVWHERVGEECRTCRDALGLMELSTFAKYEVIGPGARAYLRRLFAGRIPARDGQVTLVQMLTLRAGVLGDFTLARLGHDRYYLVGSGAAEGYHLRWMQRWLPVGGVTLRAVSDERAVLAIVGPNARQVLSRLTAIDVGACALPFSSALEVEAGPTPALVLRVSYSGELGFEIHHPMSAEQALYDALWEHADGLGMRLVGARALDAMRLEKSFLRFGAEITCEFTPRELGFMHRIDLAGEDFVGRDRLRALAGDVDHKRLCTLRVDADGFDCRAGETVTDPEGALAGYVSSGGYGHRTGLSLAMAFLEAPYAAPGTRLRVEILGEQREATVVPPSVYDPTHQRLRM